METFEHALTKLLNTYSMDVDCSTPDFILAKHLVGCLEAFRVTNNEREKWFGRDAIPVPTPESAQGKGEK